MPVCQKHGFYAHDVQGLCPKCVINIAQGKQPPPGKTPLGECPTHGFYYAKYKAIYSGCPVCARSQHG